MSRFSGLALLLVLATTGCAAASKDALRDRAAWDLNCPRDGIETTRLDDSTYGVRGCDRRATYVEHCNGQPGYMGTRCTWVLNSADRPAPAPSTTAPGAPSPQPPAPEKPLPPEARHRPRYHDGFYARVTVGGGFTFGSSKAGSYDSGAVALGAAFGGTPAPGLVVGGTFRLLQEPIIDDRAAEGTRVRQAGRALIGPVVDWYPNPSDGFHVLGAVGFAHGYVELTVPSGVVRMDAPGVGASAGVGYEWFVTNGFSAGLLAQANYDRLAMVGHELLSDSGTWESAWQTLTPTLLAAGTFH